MSLQEIVLAEPRGFCAGVDRAIDIVDRALEKFGGTYQFLQRLDLSTYGVLRF